MFCIKCGKEIPDNSRFCDGCGAPQTVPQVTPDFQQAPETQPTPDVQADQSPQPTPEVQLDQSSQQAPETQPTPAPQVNQDQPQASVSPTEEHPQPTQDPQLDTTQASGQYTQTTQGQPTPQPTPTPAAVKAPMDPALKLKIIIGACAAGAVILFIILFSIFHKKTINLNDYVKVNFNGYEGYGRAEVSIDRNKLSKDCLDAAGIDEKDVENINNLSELGKTFVKYKEVQEAIDSVSAKVEKSEGLKNGDKVKITFDFDNEKAAENKIKFEGDSFSKDVKGLDEVKEIDPFESITVTYDGTAPDAYARFEVASDEDAVKSLYFEFDKSSDLKKGDTIVLKVSSENVNSEDFVSTYGVTITKTEQEYTVDAVDSYIDDAEQLGDEVLEEIKGQTEDTVEAYFAEVKEDVKHGPIKYAGYYMLAAKPDSSQWEKNILYMIFEANVAGKSKDSFKAKKVYFPVKFNNIIEYADGTQYVDLNSTYILGSTELKYGWWSTVKGYTSLTKMRNELVTANKANYDEYIVDIPEK